jgi:N-acyl-phosphatidylethanolamine-hydrolysing phospholipase D
MLGLDRHAAFLVELPAPEGASRGPRVLFDPVFLNRCSPSQWVGPARYTKVPCTVADLPAVDAVVISVRSLFSELFALSYSL